MFAASFRNSAIGSMGCSFVKCYIRLVEIKDFDALIDNKQFFDQPIKKQEVYGKLVEISINNYYKTGSLFGYS